MFRGWRKLAARYADRKPDLADLCLICLSETAPEIPGDHYGSADFRVYRRAGAS